MKKFFVLLFILNSICFASDKLRVEALEDFDSEFPKDYYKVKLLEDERLDNILMIENDIINCKTEKITDPKRAKRNAKIYFSLDEYEDYLGTHKFKDKYIARYEKTTLSENKGKIAKKAGLIAGSFVVKGLNYGVSFAEGIKENEENNRFKSGIKRVYDDSFLSYIKYGEEIKIQKGEKFYLIVKKADENDTFEEEKYTAEDN